MFSHLCNCNRESNSLKYLFMIISLHGINALSLMNTANKDNSLKKFSKDTSE